MKNSRQNGKVRSDMKKCKMFLFDLDGILLQSDRLISNGTLAVLKRCKENKAMTGKKTKPE